MSLLDLDKPRDDAARGPDYASGLVYGPETLRPSLVRRYKLLMECSASLRAQQIELELCRRDVTRFFNNWAWTFDPKAAAEYDLDKRMPAWQPFDLFPRQAELLRFVDDRLAAREDGLVEKSREIGYTWLMGGYAWHKWRFVSGFKTTFGSRVVPLVDRLGDPDSIFEKIRMLMRGLPPWFLPPGWRPAFHDHHMLLSNPENGNTIRGEGGDEMGRGGRSTLYVIDEAAFLDHGDRVDAATHSNADTRIWGSTINPQAPNNFFTRKRFGGTFTPQQIFRFHWSDDPRKTPAWAEKKRNSIDRWLWASEYDIDYSVQVEDICIPAPWIESAKKIGLLQNVTWFDEQGHQSKVLDTPERARAFAEYLKAQGREAVIAPAVNFQPTVEGIVGGDVGGGKARSVCVARFGPIVLPPIAWGDPDTIDTAFKMMDYAQSIKIARPDGWECKVRTLRFDLPGVGLGVASAMKRNPRPGLLVVGINTGDKPTETRWPEGKTAQDLFANMKAEAWWTARAFFKRTHEMYLLLTGQPDGHRHPPEEMLWLPPDSAGPEAQQMAAQLSLPKWNRNEKGKILIESKISLASRGIASPDRADAFILTFCGSGKAERWAAFAKVNIN